MAVRPVHALLISLLLYELTSGDYCRNEDNASIQFCQSGTVSGSNVYVNGSSVKTKEDLMDRGCVCYLEQTENENVLVSGGGSCAYCSLQVLVRDVYFRFNYFDRQTYGWGSTVLNDTKFNMTMGLDGTGYALNTAFCIKIIANKKNSSVVLNLTCEGMSSTAISTSPNVITMPSTMVLDTTKGMSPTPIETAIPLKTETMTHTVVIARNTNGTYGPKANNTNRVTTTTGNDPGEPRLNSQKEASASSQRLEIVVGAAVGGSCAAVVLVIVITVIIFICYKRRLKNMYMQRQSTAPARVYTELEFGSRDGQNDSHVYSSVEPQQIYNNNNVQ